MKYIFMASPGSGGTFVRHFLELYYKENIECNKAAKLFEPILDCLPIAHHICQQATGIKNNHPDIKIIHLTRNGFDATNSRIINNHGTSEAMETKVKEKLKINKDKLHIQFAKIWADDIKEATKLKGYKNYLELTYEDFCSNPEDAVEKIEDFLKTKNKESKQYLKDSLVFSKDKHKSLPKEIIQDITPIIKPINKLLKYEN